MDPFNRRAPQSRATSTVVRSTVPGTAKSDSISKKTDPDSGASPASTGRHRGPPDDAERVRGGALGEACAISLDLTCRGDVQMFKRAVANGWEVPAPVMNKLLEQVPRALEVLPDRSKFQLIKALVLLEAKSMRAEGFKLEDLGVPVHSFPESSRARRRRPR